MHGPSTTNPSFYSLACLHERTPSWCPKQKSKTTYMYMTYMYNAHPSPRVSLKQELDLQITAKLTLTETHLSQPGETFLVLSFLCSAQRSLNDTILAVEETTAFPMASHLHDNHNHDRAYGSFSFNTHSFTCKSISHCTRTHVHIQYK